MLPIFYHSEYTAGESTFDTVRKPAWVYEELVASGLGFDFREPKPLTRQEAAIAHDLAYLDALQTGTPVELALSAGITWDPETYGRAMRGAGGMLRAAYAALETGAAGTLSSGLHHARREHGEGFCQLNGLAIAAKHLARRGHRVLILDLDAHGGGGTWSIVCDDPMISQIDLSVCIYDLPPNEERSKQAIVFDSAEYLPRIQKLLLESSPADIILYNAGVDPHEKSIGGLEGVTTEMMYAREEMVFAFARNKQIPIAWTLAGGYSEEGTGGSLRKQTLLDMHVQTARASLANVLALQEAS